MKRVLAACFALFLVFGDAEAQTAARNDVLQKELFVRRLLEAAQPPLPSDAPARQLHASALELLGRGELAAADARLNEAVRSVQRQRQASAAPASSASRYAALASGVEQLRVTYKNYGRARDDLFGTLLFEVAEAQQAARALHDGGRTDEAVRVLERAEQALTLSLNYLLGSVTVDYAPRFRAPAEEYEHELARHRAYAALAPGALRQLSPSPSAVTLVNRYVESAAVQQAQAEKLAAARDFGAALKALATGTLYLQRGLGAAGLVVPQGIPE